MRVALLTYSTRARGGVVHTLNLAEALVEAGCHVDVWSLARGGDEAFFRPVDPAVGLRLVPFPTIEDEPVGRRIVRSIELLGAAFDPSGVDSSGYDVVHAQDCISANAVPDCIRTIHHLDTFTTPELVACHDRAIRRPYARLCVSAAVAAEVEQQYGFRPDVIPNGVEYERFAAGRADHPARAEWANRLGRYVLSVGGIEPRKGTLDLVRAMALVQAAEPDIELVIAGGETLFDYRDYRAEVDTTAAALGVRMTVLGPVPQATLPSLVAQAGVLGFPSVKEGFGLAAMEAMAAGVPVVMRDLPVLREIFGGHARFAADVPTLADGLLTALTAPDPQQLRTAAELAQGYRWADVARQHLMFYAQVVGADS